MTDATLPDDVVLGGEPPVTDEDIDRWAAGGPEPKFDLLAEGKVNLERAEYAMRRVRAMTAHVAEVEAQASEWLERVEAWVHDETKRDRDRLRYYEGLLADTLRRLNEANPEVKSLSLPSGRITSSGPKPGNEWETKIADPDALLAWAEAHFPDVVKVKRDVLVTDLREKVWRADQRGVFALAPETNELLAIPGVTVERKERTFKVKPAE